MNNEKKKFWLYIAPFIIGFTLFTLGPMLASIYLSFTRYDVLTSAEWIGIGNYTSLFQNDRFWTLFGNTLYYVFIGVPINVVASLIVALVLYRNIPAISFFRTTFYLPSIFGGVAILILWNYMLAPGFQGENVGVINALLAMVGIDGPGWLSDPNWAKPAIIMTQLWGVGGNMLILLPALASVPQDQLEAADIDGASSIRKFFSVVIPQISPSLFFMLTMGMINTFKMFNEPMILPGADRQWTDTLMVHLYSNAFENYRMGYASALAWVMFVIIMFFTLIQLGLGKKWVHYE
ncbi:multiple sugar transport system permease protein [Amphibacillus marinus]|uniref:Multiple sugar transport system permease protein n=1 Tax=Amphibacillus marinus TaxID=872970 RepID=A0A1H8TAJ8_9BACI|nr:sugar ABC transporter permease [Amphibacillus marinus]SEO87891.1 multiple sugar transport system permease protein [Amphibacillus marinus]